MDMIEVYNKRSCPEITHNMLGHKRRLHEIWGFRLMIKCTELEGYSRRPAKDWSSHSRSCHTSGAPTLPVRLGKVSERPCFAAHEAELVGLMECGLTGSQKRLEEQR